MNMLSHIYNMLLRTSTSVTTLFLPPPLALSRPLILFLSLSPALALLLCKSFDTSYNMTCILRCNA